MRLSSSALCQCCSGELSPIHCHGWQGLLRHWDSKVSGCLAGEWMFGTGETSELNVEDNFTICKM